MSNEKHPGHDMHRRNVVLIGMPGSGKSTVGVLLAKATARPFVDTDVYIQARRRRTLQNIIDAEGRQRFCEIEEEEILSLDLQGHVVATGGSVVYSDRAMAHLQAGGIVVHLNLPFELLQQRILNLGSRGVVMASGQSLRSLYEERQPLYRRWADLTVDCAGRRQEELVEEIIRQAQLSCSLPS